MRWFLPLLILVGAVALGTANCSTNSENPTADLANPNSLAVAGTFLLIADTDNSELRALDLSANPRSFVRAPNPLSSLSIPVAPLPHAVAAFTAPDGGTAPFAVALSTAASQVTVVSTSTDRSKGLRALGSRVVTDTTLSVALREVSSDLSELILGVTVRDTGTLYTVPLQASLVDMAVPDAGVDRNAIADSPAEARVDLGASRPQVLVVSPTNTDLVFVGDGLEGVGGLAICTLSTGSVERFDVGGPVSALSVDPSGTFVYGVLDSQACTGSSPCAGVFGFDVSSRALLQTAPLQIPGGPRGIAAGVETTLLSPSITVDPLVLVSSLDGSIYLVNGATMELIQTSTSTPDAGIADAGSEDAGIPDTGIADAGSEDAGAPDAGGEDGGDAGIPGTGEDAGAVPDAGIAISFFKLTLSDATVPGAMVYAPSNGFFYAVFAGSSVLAEIRPNEISATSISSPPAGVTELH